MPKRYPHEQFNGMVEYDDEAQDDVRALVPNKPEKIKETWRPWLSEAALAALETALKLDCPIDEACALVGIWRSTYYKYWKKYQWFRERMQRAIDYPKALARAAVMKQIIKWDGKLALRYLQMRDKRMWATQVVEEENVEQAPVVQFISVNAKWQEHTTAIESQTSTMQSTPLDSSVTILENKDESNETWENEAEISERLNSLSSSNG